MILLKADKNTEAGVLPDEKLLTAMGKYNDEMARVGVLLVAEGLHPSSKGARVRLSEGKRTVRDAVNAKVMKDPRLAKMMDEKSMPFDPKQMVTAASRSWSTREVIGRP
jgi:hypothetical protein